MKIAYNLSAICVPKKALYGNMIDRRNVAGSMTHGLQARPHHFRSRMARFAPARQAADRFESPATHAKALTTPRAYGRQT
jgi:hypothetical protein